MGEFIKKNEEMKEVILKMKKKEESIGQFTDEIKQMNDKVEILESKAEIISREMEEHLRL